MNHDMMDDMGEHAVAQKAAKPKRDYVADHMRRTLRKAGLTALEAKQFTENTPAEKRHAFSRKLPRYPMQSNKSFEWATSPEGWNYWRALGMRLNMLAR